MMWCTYCQKSDHDDAQCWCTRADNGPKPPMHKYAAALPKEAPGFHKLTILPRCKDREHDIPSLLIIPAGMRYVHYCPSCGAKSAMNGREVSC